MDARPNRPETVAEVVRTLAEAGQETALFGGLDLRVTTAENLTAFRRGFRGHEPWRWKDPASLVAPSSPEAA